MDDWAEDLGDEQLAERTRGGDRDAYAVLWNRHARAGLVAARQFRSIADPDDIVSEAYLQIFRAFQRGGGPRESFRPYLYRTIRNISLTWNQKAGPENAELSDELEADGPSVEDTVLDKTITARAFRTLPERWQSILWYTEVEGMDPAEAAPFLGLTPNSAAALAYRAREGFKKAWLQAHVGDERIPAGCRWTTSRMADYNRGSLSARATKRFEEHLETCTRCSILVEEVDEVSGRLAIILLPLMVGGAAGAAMLADAQPASATTATPTAPATPARSGRPSARHLTLVSAGVVGVVAIAAAIGLPAISSSGPSGPVAVESSSDTPPAPDPAPSTPPSTSTTAPETRPPMMPEPVPKPQAPTVVDLAPTRPEPAAPPQRPPAPDDAPEVEEQPADVTPPIAPVVSWPVDGTLTNDARPTVSGSGEPGARLTMNNTGATIAATTVGADGAWSMRPASVVPDGVQTFAFQQIDSAGNPSPSVSTTMTIDTIALAPIVEELPATLRYLPTLEGAGEPHAAVTVTDETGTTIGSTTVAEDGTWSIPVPDPLRDDAVLTAVQTDEAGNTSAASAPTAPLRFERPTFVSPSPGTVVTSTNGEAIVTLQVSGVPGATVEFLIDGVSTGNRHTLTAEPITRVTPPLSDGPHVISVRYLDPATGAVGSEVRLPIVVRA